jgi:hypothetical protein
MYQFSRKIVQNLLRTEPDRTKPGIIAFINSKSSTEVVSLASGRHFDLFPLNHRENGDGIDPHDIPNRY